MKIVGLILKSHWQVTVLLVTSCVPCVKVSYLIAAEGKPFNEGEFVKRCILTVVAELMPDKKRKLFQEISLSEEERFHGESRSLVTMFVVN